MTQARQIAALSNLVTVDETNILPSITNTIQAGAFHLSPKTVYTNQTIPSTMNAMSTGPITINTGVTVTIATGSRWVIL